MFTLSPLRRAVPIAGVLIALLLAGITAYAQSALPADEFYPWKLATENAARAFNPVQADLWISGRRANELMAVRHDPTRFAIAWEQYRLAMDRLLSYDDPKVSEQVAATLRQQWEMFILYGVPIPHGIVALPLPTATPTTTRTASPELATLLPTLTSTTTPTSGPTPTGGPARTPFVLPTFPPPPPLPTLPPTPTSPIPIVTILPTIPPFPCPFPPPICPP